jgi:hypothetical protein
MSERLDITRNLPQARGMNAFRVEVHKCEAESAYTTVEYFKVLLRDNVETVDESRMPLKLIPHPLGDGSTEMFYMPSPACILELSEFHHSPQYPSLEHIIFSSSVWKDIIPVLADVLSNIGCVKTITLLLAPVAGVTDGGICMSVEDIYEHPHRLRENALHEKEVYFSIYAEQSPPEVYPMTQATVDEITSRIRATPGRSDFEWPVMRYALAEYKRARKDKSSDSIGFDELKSEIPSEFHDFVEVVTKRVDISTGLDEQPTNAGALMSDTGTADHGGVLTDESDDIANALLDSITFEPTLGDFNITIDFNSQLADLQLEGGYESPDSVS